MEKQKRAKAIKAEAPKSIKEAAEEMLNEFAPAVVLRKYNVDKEYPVVMCLSKMQEMIKRLRSVPHGEKMKEALDREERFIKKVRNHILK